MIPSINPLVLNLKKSATLSFNMEVFPRLAKGYNHLAKYLETLASDS